MWNFNLSISHSACVLVFPLSDMTIKESQKDGGFNRDEEIKGEQKYEIITSLSSSTI